jgi:hypothetical protein
MNRRYAIHLQRIALSQQRKRSGHATSAADSAAQRSLKAAAKAVCHSCAGSESTNAPRKVSPYRRHKTRNDAASSVVERKDREKTLPKTLTFEPRG